MALDVGSKITHYDVTALIGEGGMGRVYQATDTKLNRQVALKILPEAFSVAPDSRRFLVRLPVHPAGAELILVQNWLQALADHVRGGWAMTVSPGNRLGVYAVTAKIGESSEVCAM